MIKILFFIDTTLASGGAEKVLRNLVNNMDQSKFEITVQTVWPEEAEKYLVPGIRYRSVYRSKNRMNRILFRLEAQLGLLYRRHMADDYDIEIAYLECGPTKILASSTNRKAKKVAWVHCDLMRMTDDPESFARKAEKWYRKFDRVVCVSRTVLDSYRRLFNDITPSRILYNTVDDAQVQEKAHVFHSEIPQSDRTTIAAVGRMYPVKGYDRLLDAMHRLIREGLEADLWIIGDGPDRDALVKQAKDLGIDRFVRFLGFRKNPYPYMMSADVIACSSHYEGFSTVVTEALILGKPVVTTYCSGMHELLGDSQCGVITPNSTEGIYLGLKKLLENPDLRKQYAQAAALRGKAFSKEKLVGETEDFFCKLLKE